MSLMSDRDTRRYLSPRQNSSVFLCLCQMLLDLAVVRFVSQISCPIIFYAQISSNIYRSTVVVLCILVCHPSTSYPTPVLLYFDLHILLYKLKSLLSLFISSSYIIYYFFHMCLYRMCSFFLSLVETINLPTLAFQLHLALRIYTIPDTFLRLQNMLSSDRLKGQKSFQRAINSLLTPQSSGNINWPRSTHKMTAGVAYQCLLYHAGVRAANSL